MSGSSTDGRNDEAIQRLRAESARRIAREARWRTFAAWCALATIAGGISLAALDAREARLQAEEAAAERAAVARAHAAGGAPASRKVLVKSRGCVLGDGGDLLQGL